MKNRLKKVMVVLIFAASHFFNVVHADYVKPHIEHAKMCHMKAVIPITTDNPKIDHIKLMTMSNMVEGAKMWGGSIELRAILYSDGVDLLVKPSAELKKTIDQLRAQGVKFYVCNNTLRGKDLDYHSLYGVDEAYIVPSGALEVIYLQQCSGFSVGPLN